MDDYPKKLTAKNLAPFGILAAAILVITVLAALLLYFFAFAAPEKRGEPERFVIPLTMDTTDAVAQLKDEGFIKNQSAFLFALKWKKGEKRIEAGGYKISKSMNVWGVAEVFSQKPYMEWVVIPEGLRKEEIAEILQSKLDWPSEETEKWITTYTPTKYEYTEGVYFPDTYLIPRDEAPRDTAKRFQTKFEEKFAPYAKEALKQNIRWYTLLRIASIVQREAAGTSDMPLIAGILWSRLLTGMKLEVDATIQYVRGNTKDGWWAPIRPEDKEIDSPYNTYKYKGLPPHPISNPGLDAVKAVLFPEKTECFYYLHDNSQKIHCAQTFEEHQKNIEMYLR